MYIYKRIYILRRLILSQELLEVFAAAGVSVSASFPLKWAMHTPSTPRTQHHTSSFPPAHLLETPIAEENSKETNKKSYKELTLLLS